MPIISTNIKKTVLKNQFKRVYSNLSNALNKTAFEMGDTNCYYYYPDKASSSLSGYELTGCIQFYEEFMKNLKVIKYCEKNALANGCIEKDYNFASTSGCQGFDSNHINNRNPAYVLNDGTIIALFGSNWPLIMIDINGSKGPNLVGRDIFTLSFKTTLADRNSVRFTNFNGEDVSIVSCISQTDYPISKYYFWKLSDIFK